MEHFYTNIPGWCNFESLYSQAVALFPGGSHFVEIGAWEGQSSVCMAVEIINSRKTIKFDVIDTWEGSPSERGTKRKMRGYESRGTTLYGEFVKNIAPVAYVIHPMVMDSILASELYKDHSLDFIFVDADHSYEALSKDLEVWHPKLRQGGIIAGHDYLRKNYPGVTQAVHEFFGAGNVYAPSIGGIKCWIHDPLERIK